MIEHVTEWLGTYLDGELRGWRLHRVESHLAECAACRSELKSLQNLSKLLQDTHPAQVFRSSERFATNLTLNLPRQPVTVPARKAPSLGWWLVPVALLGAWIFLQTLSLLSGTILVLNSSDLLGKASAWLSTGPHHTEWFATTMNLFGGQMGTAGQDILSVFDRATLFGSNVLVQLFWQMLVALLYWGWLATWWFRRRDPAVFGRRLHQ